MRQSNQEFANLLTKIGNGDLLNDGIQKLIESRFFTKEKVLELCPNGIRIFLKNNSVTDYNSTTLLTADKVTSIATDVLLGCNNVQQETNFRQVLHKKSIIDTSGLPFEISFVIGKPYLITTNIDVSDGLANGALGKLNAIERSENGEIKRIWLEFPESPNTGRKLRNKVSAYAQSNNISRNAVPIAKKNSTFALNSNKTISCKRHQFPLISACAMTIHKSQGGTFSEVVYEYEKNHIRSLVYVALSRVTNINGLFISSPNNDSTFYHGRLKSTSTELKNEFQRLSSNQLLTLHQTFSDFINTSEGITIFTFNCQSLRAHVQDLADPITLGSHFLILSETWLNDNEDVDIPNFNCIVKFKRQNVRAGGVAIFKNNLKITDFLTPHSEISDRQTTNMLSVVKPIGDICATEYTLTNGQTLLLCAIYISPNHTVQQIIDFIHFTLLPYSIAGSQLLQKQYHTFPMILGGDFNINFNSNEATALITFLKDHFNMSLNTNKTISTTKGGTTIDAVFQRNLQHMESKVFVSYFSYHKPVVSILQSA